MFRIILGILASLFLFSVVRTIIEAMKKEFMEQTRSASSGGGARPAAQQPPKVVGGELRKCPACGTYHAVPNIAGKTRDGELVHFCSAECREKFAA